MKIKWGSVIIMIAFVILMIFLVSLLFAPRTCAKKGCNKPVGKNGTWCEYHATMEYWEYKYNSQKYGD